MNTTIEKLPRGGHTIEGLLARSNTEIAKRFASLEDDAAAKAAAHEGALAAYEAGQRDVQDAQRAQANLQASYAHFKLSPDSRESSELASAAEAVERAKGVVRSKLAPALRIATDRSSGAKAQVANARRVLAGRKTEHVLRLRRVDPATPEGMSILDAIAARTTTLGEKKLRRGAVATALPPADTVKRALRAQVSAAAARANVELTGLFGGSQKVSFALPTVAFDDVEPNRFRPNAQPRIFDFEALACRFWGPQIIADLDAKIDAEYSDDLGDEVLDAAEKRRFLAEIDREIDLLEREIAELIWRAREEAHDIDFPDDLPAAAVLGIA